jgi:hypothetical protein
VLLRLLPRGAAIHAQADSNNAVLIMPPQELSAEAPNPINREGMECRRTSIGSRRLRKRVDLGLRPVGTPGLQVMPMHHVVVR